MSTLRELLQDKAGRLYKKFEGLIPLCETHLEYATPPEFTMHGVPHCVRVERNLDDLIPDRLKKAMSGTEIYILLCGAWFHDFGMVKHSDRPVHNVQSARQIQEKWGNSIGWPYAHVVKRLCYAHRDHEVNGEKINTLSELRRDTTVANDSVYPQFLAALLRLADELDTTYERAPFELKDIIPESEESKREWQTHQLIKGVRIDPDIFLIELYPYCERILKEEDGEVIYARHAKIERELRGMQVYLDSVYREVYKLGYRHIEIELCPSVLTRKWWNEYRAEQVLEERARRAATRPRGREPEARIIIEPSVEQDISMVMDIDRDIGERIRAIDRLGKPGNFDASECLLRSLMDDDSEIRLASVKSLGKIGDLVANKPLIELLITENEPKVYEAIPGSIIPVEEIVPATGPFEHDVMFLKLDADAEGTLRRVLMETSGRKFDLAARIVSNFGSPELIQEVLIKLKHHDLTALGTV